MEFIRHRWKMILLMALLTAAVLGGAMLFWSSTKEKTYTGGLFVKEEVLYRMTVAGQFWQNNITQTLIECAQVVLSGEEQFEVQPIAGQG